MTERKRHPWTNKEIERLKLYYPTMPWERLEREFYPHPLESIKTVASRSGTRRKRQQRDWMKVVAEYKPVIFAGAT